MITSVAVSIYVHIAFNDEDTVINTEKCAMVRIDNTEQI